MRKKWTNAIEELKVWMENQDTDEYITTAITQHLLHWYDPTTPVNQSPPSEISAAIRQQSLLGWEQLVFGRLGTYWGESQLRYVQANRPTKIKSIRRWKASLVRKLLEMAWDFWDHRNGELHRVELSILHHDIQVHIRQEFSLGDINNHRLRQLMKPGADAITARPLAQQQDWLRSVRIHRSHHQASSEFRQQQQQQRIMATWLRSGQSDRAT